MTDLPAFFELTEEYAYFRPAGEMSLEGTAGMVGAAIAWCVEKEIRRLLINITGLSGFASPSPAERRALVTQWAEVARCRVMVALVARPEWIGQERFAPVLTRQHGLLRDAFTSEPEAAAWLVVEERAKLEKVG